jgi:hypothetical protein
MFCKKCGKEMTGTPDYCPNCGERTFAVFTQETKGWNWGAFFCLGYGESAITYG